MQGHHTIGFNKASPLTPLIICSSSLPVITCRRKLYSPALQAAQRPSNRRGQDRRHPFFWKYGGPSCWSEFILARRAQREHASCL